MNQEGNSQQRFTPDRITELGENEIFVFGSNLSGMHGGGAALLAYRKFGAIWGQGVGLQGQLKPHGRLPPASYRRASGTVLRHSHHAGWSSDHQALCR